MNTSTTIDFYGQPLVTFERDGSFYTAMKPICENIGLDWRSQRKRINRDEVLSEGVVMMTTPSKGGSQDMFCLPITYLNGWLFGIDVKRVKESVRDTLIRYKKECYQALYDFWHQGAGVERRKMLDAPSSVKDRNGLNSACRMAAKKINTDFSEIYSMIHQRFNVKHLADLSVKEVAEATEYVQRIILNPAEGRRLRDSAVNFVDTNATPLQMSEVFSQAHGRTTEWLHTLYKQVNDAGGEIHYNKPIDPHAVWMAFVKDVITANRWMVSMDDDGQINMKLVEPDKCLVNYADLPHIIQDPERIQSRYVLPILNACIQRIAKKGLPAHLIPN